METKDPLTMTFPDPDKVSLDSNPWKSPMIELVIVPWQSKASNPVSVDARLPDTYTFPDELKESLASVEIKDPLTNTFPDEESVSFADSVACKSPTIALVTDP